MIKLSFKNIVYLVGGLVVLGMVGCTSVVMPAANPNKSDLTKKQAAELSKRKLHVPCRVEVHCADSLVGNTTSMWTDYDKYYYPLQDILTNSFQSAAYIAFDQPGGEIIDAFTIYVTVPESRLNVSNGKAGYNIQIIVRFLEPGEKKITALSFKKHYEAPFVNEEEVPPVIYEAARDLAFRTMKKFLSSPKVIRTVKRFEDK
jgi:hypothetical protein